jgi:hypothetical protein
MNLVRKYRIYRLFIALVFIFTLFLSSLGSLVSAQFQVQPLPETEINIELSPENPGPHESVYVLLTSYSTNINAASITWRVNGQTKRSGRGEKSFSFETGAANTTTTLGITVATVEGEVINKTISLRPVTVDLIWQSNSFVPPFYKGKALFSYQNDVTFIALPHITSGGVEISPKNLIYKWTLNGKVIDYASGYGKNTYIIQGDIIAKTLNVEVEVTTSNSTSRGRSSLTLAPRDPQILLYKKSPIYGVEFQKALINTVNLTDSKEITVVGMPYFFGTEDAFSPDLSYKWSINNLPVDKDFTQTSRVFRQKEGSSGVSRISLSIENRNKILQLAGKSFDLKFESPAETTASF